METLYSKNKNYFGKPGGYIWSAGDGAPEQVMRRCGRNASSVNLPRCHVAAQAVLDFLGEKNILPTTI